MAKKKKNSIQKLIGFETFTKYGVKATPHKERLTALYVICLHIFRHLAQKILDRR